MFNVVYKKLDKVYFGIDGSLKNWCICSIEDKYVKINIEPNINRALKFINPNNLILIDIPIGLSSKNKPRKIDQKLREMLPKGKKGSVFSAACRNAILADDYHLAKKINISETNKSISIQSWNISSKIKEVDQFLIKNSQFNIHESHPELCFTFLNNQIPLKNNKKTNQGLKERFKILNKYIENSETVVQKYYYLYKGENLKKDDIVDAISLAISAQNWAKNGQRKITQTPLTDDKGIAFEIYY